MIGSDGVRARALRFVLGMQVLVKLLGFWVTPEHRKMSYKDEGVSWSLTSIYSMPFEIMGHGLEVGTRTNSSGKR